MRCLLGFLSFLLLASTAEAASPAAIGPCSVMASPSIGGDTTSGLCSNAASSVSVEVSGTQKMIVGTNGVGIGTASAANALDVYTGGIHIGSNTPSSTTGALYAVGSLLYWSGAAVPPAASPTFTGTISAASAALTGNQTIVGNFEVGGTTRINNNSFTVNTGSSGNQVLMGLYNTGANGDGASIGFYTSASNALGAQIYSTRTAGSFANDLAFSTDAAGSGTPVEIMRIVAGTGVAIGTTTLVSGSTFTLAGHPAFADPAPAVTSCGGGTLLTGSSDNKGQITGITAATACTITFSTALPAAPACTFATSTGIAVGGIPSTTAVTTTMAALTGTLAYHCF